MCTNCINFSAVTTVVRFALKSMSGSRLTETWISGNIFVACGQKITNWKEDRFIDWLTKQVFCDELSHIFLYYWMVFSMRSSQGSVQYYSLSSTTYQNNFFLLSFLRQSIVFTYKALQTIVYVTNHKSQKVFFFCLLIFM